MSEDKFIFKLVYPHNREKSAGSDVNCTFLSITEDVWFPFKRKSNTRRGETPLDSTARNGVWSILS